MAVTFKVDAEGVQYVLRTVPGLLARNVKDEWKKLGVDFQKGVASRFASQHPAAGRRAKYWVLDQNVRRLRQYRKGPDDPGMKPGEAELGVFSQNPLLLAHELGSKITDPGGGSLAIPMGDAATKKLKRAKGLFKKNGTFAPSLVAEYRLFRKKNQSSDFRVIKLRGKLYAAQIDEAGEIVDLYARIVKSVKLRPTLGFYETWEKMGPQRAAAIDRALKSTIRFLNSPNVQRPEFLAAMKPSLRRSPFEDKP